MIGLLVPLLVVCCTGPGLLIVGRLRLSPIEKLCGAFVASFLIVYLASFVLFCLSAGAWAYWTTSGLLALMGLLGWRTAGTLLSNRRARGALIAYGVVLLWDFLHLAMVRHYGGGNWAADWREQYERTQYFLRQLPWDFVFVRRYLLPARPPLMNLIAAFFCRQVGLTFEAFSLIYLWLNAWAIVPCCYFLWMIAPRRRMVLVLIVLFMLNPSIVENATLTVTKAMAAALVVAGVCFYLRRRLICASITLGAAVLVHYSACPFAVAVGLHCLFTRPLRRTLQAASASAVLLATWIGWSLAVFGIHRTIFAAVGTTGMDQQGLAVNLRRMAYNLFTSLVPHPLHTLVDKRFILLGSWGGVRDYYFLMSQTTLPMMIGLAGGVAAICLLIRRHKPFWIYFVLFTYILGIAVNYDWNEYGCAHITLQPLALMGVTLVAAWLPSAGSAAFRLVLLGTAIDYALGILLQFDRQSYVFPTVRQADGQVIALQDTTLGRFGAGQYMYKLNAGYVFWGDHFAGIAPILEMVSIITALCALLLVARIHAKGRSRGH